jgi:gliding motility-associated-like protein
MLCFKKIFFLFLIVLLSSTVSYAQLVISPASTAQALVQKLIGEGVTISNVSLIADSRSTGFFNNISGTSIGIDSGIVLTNGRAKSVGTNIGVDGNAFTTAGSALANLTLNTAGDLNLANSIGVPVTNTYDATILEFDFVPLGDSIQFKYVFSSEEYDPSFVCDYNDAFAFFISGPGITGLRNIALIPGTNTPVSIFNVNNVPGGACPNNASYYVDNLSNTRLTHDGHTVILIAGARVQPCQSYHLKLVIADVGDRQYDSGVFLEAKSLSSNATQLINLTQTDPVSGNSYLVEGCAVGSLKIKRQTPSPYPLNINLFYGGTAQNGIDVQTLPASIVIPANQDSVLLPIFPIMDLIPEGIETLKIYTLAGCSAGLPTDSTTIQLRDYDILGITPDTSIICGNSSVMLQASGGYTNYQWDVNPGLSNINIPNPMASPITASATYICTATVGTCQAKDSAYVSFKQLKLLSKTDVNCHNGTTGQISVGAGPEWLYPLQFSIDGGTLQLDSVFNNLPIGNHTVVIKDASNCIDSIHVTLLQAFPDLVQTHIPTDASCSGTADGNITLNVTGGLSPYQYSLDGINYVNSNIIPVMMGSYSINIRDNNGCILNTGNITIGLNNTVIIDAGANDTICEGTSTQLNAISNATGYVWTPVLGLSSTAVSNPIASPIVTSQYFVSATLGICTKLDSVTLFVNPAPVPNAGADITICFGANATLQGTGAVEYSWSPSTYLSNTHIAQPISQRPKDNINYYLSIKDANGCASLMMDTMRVIVTPAVKLFAGNDSVVVAINQPVQLNVIQLGASTVTSYIWSPAYGLNNVHTATPIALLDRDFTYYVTGITPASCEGSDTINIKVYKGPEIYVPTAFTPNGDGTNDILKALAIGMKDYHYFRVFNRWGQQIFYTQNFSNGWDGRVKGVLQNTGTYVWIAEAVDFRGNVVQRKGTFSIVQ